MRGRTVPKAFLVALLLLGACSDDDDTAAPTTGLADATSTTVAPATDPVDGWPTAGRDLRNSRATTDSRIGSATAPDLTTRWRADLDGAGALSTVPIVVDGTVYLGSGSGTVYALDLATGEQRWASEPTGFNIGPFGVAVDDERVYTLDGANGVAALDIDDGARLWSADVTATPTTGIDIQPIVVDDLVIVSSVPVSTSGIYTGGDRGVVTALDAATGDVRWTFDTVDGDLWGNPEVNSGGGAWYPPAVDVERGLVYVGVANPAPFPGTPDFPNATSRPGPNLYTNSLVALDLATGALRWYHQVVPHDLFDRDQVHALLVGDVVVSAGKSGVLVGIDPDDGTVRWQTEVGTHRNDELEALDGPTEVFPGTYGGVLTPPAAAEGVVYAAVVNAPATLSPDETAYFGADLGTNDGEVVAVDAATGALLWSTPVPGDPLGGATVVGDLVVTAVLDGSVVLLRRDDGAIVRTIDAGGGINGWMAALDDVLLVPVGMSDPPSLLALGLPEPG
jgi:outer membrane protein assembly factor BamB